MTNYLYTIHIGDISRNQDNKDNLIQNIHAYAWKICNTWYFWYCLVGWSSSNPAEKSISLTPWHYIVKINFVRITKMNQIHVSKSWLVNEQCTINITHTYILYVLKEWEDSRFICCLNIYLQSCIFLSCDIRPENIINSIANQRLNL